MTGLTTDSPVEQIFDPLFSEQGIEVFVKRDDLIHPFISGNKWRKLKYNLLEAERLHKKSLVTFGGAYSNHLVATACAAARFGFSSTGIVRGEEVQNDILMLCTLFGMDIRFTDRTSYRDKRSLFNDQFGDDPTAMFIDEGGAGELAVRGCSELIAELPAAYDHIFCAAGTGTTAAGIIRGAGEGLPTAAMHVVPVLKGGEFLVDEIKKHTDHQFNIHTGYHFGGYAKTSPELLHFVRSFCRSTGILIEPVYTGKMFFALFDLASKNKFPEGSKILAVHTGGLTGLLGMSSKFSRLPSF